MYNTSMEKEKFSFTELLLKENSENIVFYTILAAMFLYIFILFDLITAIFLTIILFVPVGIVAVFTIFILAFTLDIALWFLKAIFSLFRL